MLAGLVKSPSSYAPTVGMDRAIARRNVVLEAMLETGAIDLPTFKSARAAKPVIRDGLREDEPYGQSFQEHLRRELVKPVRLAACLPGGLQSLLDDRFRDAAGSRSRGGRRVESG